MNPMETARELGGSVIDSLRGSPILLALLLFMFAYVGINFYSQSQERQDWKQLVETAMKWCPAGSYERPKQ